MTKVLLSKNTTFEVAIVILLTLVAGFRGVSSDPDAIVYEYFIEVVSKSSLHQILLYTQETGWYTILPEIATAKFEWGFSLLIWVITRFSYSTEFVFTILALLSILPKYYILKKYTEFPVIGLIWYFAYSYPALEMSAVRAGLASGILFLTVPCFLNKSLRKFIAIVLIAATMHISSLIIFVMMPLFSQIRQRVYLYVLIFITLALLSRLVYFISLEGISLKLQDYTEGFVSGLNYSNINYINFITVSTLSLGVLFLSLSSARVTDKNEYSIIKYIYFTPMLLFVSLGALPILAFRMLELIGVFQILLLGHSKFCIIRYKKLLSILSIIAIFTQFINQQYNVQNVNVLYFFTESSDVIVDLIAEKYKILN